MLKMLKFSWALPLSNSQNSPQIFYIFNTFNISRQMLESWFLQL